MSENDPLNPSEPPQAQAAPSPAAPPAPVPPTPVAPVPAPHTQHPSELTQPLSFERPSGSIAKVLLVGALSGLFFFGLMRWAKQGATVSVPAEEPVSAEPAAAAPKPVAAKPKPKAAPAVSAPAAAPAPAAAAVARPKPAAQQDSPLYFSRAKAKPVTLRCWRAESGEALLDVFGAHNQRVRTLRSGAGAAGWQELAWDGKDESGQSVPNGSYFLRPSTDKLQLVRETLVRD